MAGVTLAGLIVVLTLAVAPTARLPATDVGEMANRAAIVKTYLLIHGITEGKLLNPKHAECT